MKSARRVNLCFTNLKGYYQLEYTNDWKECIISNISRYGIGIRLLTGNKIPVGSKMTIRILRPQELELFNLKGILRWIKKDDNCLVGGIELDEILDTVQWRKLCKTDRKKRKTEYNITGFSISTESC